MIRDPGPLHNIGNGVTSRDVPFNEDETEGIAPNSGYISRALNNHPVMKFVASTATTLVVAGVLSRMTKSGGLKLGKYLESKPDGSLATRSVNTAKQIRKTLDELQGVKRRVAGVDDVDAYSKLVFETPDGKLTSGYEGAVNEQFGPAFMTAEEKRLAAAGLIHEPPYVWNLKDTIQQRLVRAGRRLPYELPAFYVAQRGIVDPLFAERDQSQRKVKWYNPADVIADFTTESVKNITTMILPMETLGAGASGAKSYIHNLKYGFSDVADMSQFQQKAHRGLVELSGLMEEVGQDLTKLTKKFLDRSNQSIGAFSHAAEKYRNQPGLVQVLSRLRRGHVAAQEANRRSADPRKRYQVTFDSLFKGHGVALLPGEDVVPNIFDTIPTFTSMRAAASAGRKEYRKLGVARDVLDRTISADVAAGTLYKDTLLFKDKDDLASTINKIQSKHKSRLSDIAADVRILGRGGPDSESFSVGQFSLGHQATAFKDLLERQLLSSGIDKKSARRFVEQIDVKPPNRDKDLTKIITIGKSPIHEVGSDLDSASLDFFDQVITRFRGISGGENVPGLTGDVLKDAVNRATAVFTSREFKRGLDNKIKNDWNKFYRDDLHQIAGSVLKPKKAIYQDFIGDRTEAKLEFLQRKTAETFGIKLTTAEGSIKSTDEIVKELSRNGFDPSNFIDLRAYLVRNRKMTAGIFEGGANLLGLQQVTIDEALDRGLFDNSLPEEKQIIRDIAARAAISDPVSKSIGLSRVDGVYKSKSGDILDFTSLKSVGAKALDFFATEFKIPILGFNPADLFGYNSFAEMRRRSTIEYVSSRSVQPFLGLADDAARPDFYMFYRTKGSKGKLISYSTDSARGNVISETLPGSYRAVPSASSDLISRHARYGSAGEGLTPDQIRAMEGESGSGRGRSLFNRFFDIDAEQPNSLFGFFSRFKNRKTDPTNEPVISRLLLGEEVSYPTKTFRDRRVRLISEELSEAAGGGKRLKAVDQFGEEVEELTERQLLKGATRLRRQSFMYGMPTPVMAELERIAPEYYKYAGRGVSELSSEKEIVDFARGLIAAETSFARKARDADIDPSEVLTSLSRIKALLNLSNLNTASMMSKTSPTISTRLDELRNEIFRFVSQSNQLLKDPTGVGALVKIQEATESLVRSGRISPSQRAEAQAAGLSTLFNTSAFSTYLDSETNAQSARAALVKFFESSSSTGELRSLFDPFTEGTVSQIGGSIRRRFSPVLAPIKRSLGTAGYQIDDLSVDPLGTGQRTTLLPTFGTVASRKVTREDGSETTNLFGAIKSAAGFGSYSDPQSFSGSSIPMSQAVERLNRYFGTLGLQLDVSKFSGPLDLYFRGMIGKRVLPLYVAGTTAMTVDRTIGGMVNEPDASGQKVYSPFFLGIGAKGVVEVQSAAAGLIPGGMTYEEKKEELVEGEVPIRQGRYWPLGHTPFKGGKIMYYRPSWYRKLQAGALFTDDTYGSPAEKFFFYNDISPLRPLDPYRFERKHYYDRPYPVTGEYFSGPFGPAVPLANLTIGRLLKPQIYMHEQAVAQGLSNYMPAGEFGAYDATAYSGGGGSSQQVPTVGFGPSGQVTGIVPGFGPSVPSGYPAAPTGFGMQRGVNTELASRTGYLNTASNNVTDRISTANTGYTSVAYGPPKVPKVMSPRIIPAGSPISAGGTEFQLGELGYRTQEMLGIYGFAAGTIREKFGFGQADFEPQRSVLQSATKAYGSSRAFWDLNLGGLGDLPIAGAGDVGSIEFSEIVRRFIPKDRTSVDYINPIPNLMGQRYPFLPGPEYYTNFRTGDPFTKVQEGEIRLPGMGYERLNLLNSDEYGRYGLVDQLNILADVAPYSQQFKTVERQIQKVDLRPDQRIKVQEILEQKENASKKYEFSEYKYRDQPAGELVAHPFRNALNRAGEYIAHSDNFIINKTIGKQTALEDWERNNVYGNTFPQWGSPVESYIKPMLNKATQDNPIVASASLGAVGALFGRTPKARLFGSAVGTSAGLLSSTFGQAYELITNDQFIPRERKKELALEEYSDILSYVRNTRLANIAEDEGNFRDSFQYKMAAKRTMYGADIYSRDIETLSLAIPKRKREHFKALVNAPVADRPRILQTAGRLERRFYQAAWGMDVEDRPDLSEYFTNRELPPEEWEGWHPNTNIDHVKIKTGQSMGLDMSQMGYYPQQIKEANLANPSYPSFFDNNDSGDIAIQLKRLMSGMGINGSVSSYNNPFGRDQFNVNAGVR